MLHNSLRTLKHEKVIARDVAICLRHAAQFSYLATLYFASSFNYYGRGYK